ncbi:MAG: C2 domain-containing protein, partial [Pseudomonadota bacterium]
EPAQRASSDDPPAAEPECDFVLNDECSGPRDVVARESASDLRVRRDRLARRLARCKPGVRLEIAVVAARDLPPMKYAGKTADAYVVARVRTRGCVHSGKTHVVRNSRYPEWRANLALPASLTSHLHLMVFDKSRVGPDDLVGAAKLDLSFLADQKLRRKWLKLRREDTALARANRTRLSDRCALRVELKLVHDRKALLEKAIGVIDALLQERPQFGDSLPAFSDNGDTPTRRPDWRRH